MNIFKAGFARTYQGILKLLSCFVKIKEPITINSLEELKQQLTSRSASNILLVTGKTVCKLKFYTELYEQLSNNFNVFTYNNISPDPTINNINEAFNEIKDSNIDHVIAIGGGSTIDASKILACVISNPSINIKKLRGILKIRKKPISVIAVPTTAGSGSCVSVASVVIDEENKTKYSISDPKLVPEIAYLNPEYLTELPSSLIASCGMDAITHAIEALIGRSNTKYTKDHAVNAIKLVFNYLISAYNNRDIESLKNMQKASYDAGIAFTRAYVGYVHAIAHALGVYYNVPHGVACGLVLPLVLKKYGKRIDNKIYSIRKELKLVKCDPTYQFVYNIEKLILSLGLSFDFSCIKDADFKGIIKHINKEVYPLYPVPKYLSDNDIKDILLKLKNTY